MILYQTYPLVNAILLETRVSEFLSVRQKNLFLIAIRTDDTKQSTLLC